MNDIRERNGRVSEDTSAPPVFKLVLHFEDGDESLGAVGDLPRHEHLRTQHGGETKADELAEMEFPSMKVIIDCLYRDGTIGPDAVEYLCRQGGLTLYQGLNLVRKWLSED